MNDPKDPLVWVSYAEEDYKVARSVLRYKKPLAHSSCFHAQQCAEKYLKAMLVDKKVSFPKTHDLIMLNNLCARAGILLGIEATTLHSLTLHAVQARYPDDALILEDAKEAIAVAQAVRRFARKSLGVK